MHRTPNLLSARRKDPRMISGCQSCSRSSSSICGVFLYHTEGSRPRSKTTARNRTPGRFLKPKEHCGLKGLSSRQTEIVRVQMQRGKLVQKSRSLLERTLYDERGQRIENETYPIVGSRTGQETHKYDAQGNLSETVVRDARGAVLSKTIYEYELDKFGNWIQMTASVVV